MNKLFIVGNLTRDPELRTTPSGVSVCSFTVAVNRRRSANSAATNQPEADFLRVSAWRQLGENCSRYLAKGRKVAVTGSVSVSTFQSQDGNTRATLEVNADDVEFLSPKGEGIAPGGDPSAPADGYGAVGTPPQGSGFVQVDDEELPF
ncbi:MAG: single-stranded DNA-binding protein [Clostridia bacterium]|nr:single-stranded DNA-binding protein [Clostridia bacterium]